MKIFSFEWYCKTLSEHFRYLENIRYPNQIFVVLGIIKGKPHSLVLDSGCGREARLSLPLLKEGLAVVSLDLPEQVVRAAFSKLKGYPHSFCVRADALHLPFKNEAFDLIVCTETIEYLSSPTCFIIDAYGVLKKEGKIVISTPNASGLQHFIIHVFALLYKLAVRLKMRPKRVLQADCRKNILAWAQLKSVLNYSGLNIIGWIGEIGIFRLLDPSFSKLNILPPGPMFRSLLQVLDIKTAEKIPPCLHSGWTVICVKKSARAS